MHAFRNSTRGTDAVEDIAVDEGAFDAFDVILAVETLTAFDMTKAAAGVRVTEPSSRLNVEEALNTFPESEMASEADTVLDDDDIFILDVAG